MALNPNHAQGDPPANKKETIQTPDPSLTAGPQPTDTTVTTPINAVCPSFPSLLHSYYFLTCASL